MTWTNLNFSFGSVLTSAKMTQLSDNITAQANGDSGAPKQQTAGIADGAVTAAKFAVVSAGTVYLEALSDLDYEFTYSTSFVKLKEIYVPCAGTVRTSFFLRGFADSGGSGSAIAHGRVYVNGIAVGTDRAEDESGTTYTEDISVAAQDAVQLYARTTSASLDSDVYDFKLGINSASIGVIYGRAV